MQILAADANGVIEAAEAPPLKAEAYARATVGHWRLSWSAGM